MFQSKEESLSVLRIKPFLFAWLVARWQIPDYTADEMAITIFTDSEREEKDSTDHRTGLDDGSEYTPDGNYIYFNSVRTGMMQIWRMKPDGSEQEQVTFDNLNNWFPHISPDGKWIVFLTFNNDVAPGDHPFYKHVYLRMMPVSGGKPKVIAYLYGGQGTINVPSWSPDSRKIAFVSNSDGIE